MCAEIAKLHRRLGTTIYVTHDQTEAMTMADRNVIMKDISYNKSVLIQEVYNTPNNVFVADSSISNELLQCNITRWRDFKW